MKTAGRWLLLPLSAVLVASLVLVMAAEATLPNTGDAPARVEAILRAHSGVEVSLPTRVGQAIVAVEDHRFYSHHGIDVLSLVRAGWTHLNTGADGGGATITVQLVENLYLPSPSSVSQAAQVARYALAIERGTSKIKS